MRKGAVDIALAHLEATGGVLRGYFTPGLEDEEFCEPPHPGQDTQGHHHPVEARNRACIVGGVHEVPLFVGSTRRLHGGGAARKAYWKSSNSCRASKLPHHPGNRTYCPLEWRTIFPPRWTTYAWPVRSSGAGSAAVPPMARFRWRERRFPGAGQYPWASENR